MVHAGVEVHLPWADEVWHAGDIGPPETIQWFAQRSKLFRAIAGNADPRESLMILKNTALFQVEGIRVMMHHIVGKPGKYTPEAEGLVKKHNPDWVVCGHSHILLLAPRLLAGGKKGLHINPGAAGHHGFHPLCTMLRLVVEGGKLSSAEAVELGPRGRVKFTP